MRVRPAGADDVAAMSALSAEDRRGRAQAEPDFWRMAEGADLHGLWIEYLVGDDDQVTLVAENDGQVVGWLWAAPLADRWQVDDWTVTGGRGADAGRALIDQLPHHLPGSPTVVAIGEHHLQSKTACLTSAGYAPAAQYRVLRLDQSEPEPASDVRLASGDADANAVVGLLSASSPPPHGFPAIGPDTPGGLTVVADDDGEMVGAAVGSPSGPAPPIYDPGGTTCVADRVVGARRVDLLAGLEHHARARGDVQLLVIADTDDTELTALLDQRRYRHPVSLWSTVLA